MDYTPRSLRTRTLAASRRGGTTSQTIAAASRSVVETLEARRLLHGGMHLIDWSFNFQPGGMPHSGDMFVDIGRPWGIQGDAGGDDAIMRYGWLLDGSPVYNTWTGSTLSSDPATQQQHLRTYNSLGWSDGLSWELAIPSGTYDITVIAGDPVYRGEGQVAIAAEGQTILQHTPTPDAPYTTATATVEVTDGRLSITSPTPGASANLLYLGIVTEGLDNGGGDPFQDPEGFEPLARINFRPAEQPPYMQGGFLSDIGAAFGPRGGGALSYGWTVNGDPVANDNIVHRPGPFIAGPVMDARFNNVALTDTVGGMAWEIGVPDGRYMVRIVAGDPQQQYGIWHYRVEGKTATVHNPQHGEVFSNALVEVEVTDGRLTISNGEAARNNALAWVEVFQEIDDNGGGEGQVTFGPQQNLTHSTWTHAEHARVVYDGKIFAFGGFDGEGGTWPGGGDWISGVRSEVYDPATNSWSEIASLPVEMSHHMATVWNDRIYLFGGVNMEGDLDTIYAYDPAADEYELVGNLPLPFSAMGLVRFGDHVHLLGGQWTIQWQDWAGTFDHHWRVDLNDLDGSWEQMAPLPEGRHHVTAVGFDNHIYVFGGQEGEVDFETARDNLWRYDPATDQWEILDAMPEERAHTSNATVVWGDHILMLGGNANGTIGDFLRKTIWVYNPAENSWSEIGEMTELRYAGAVSIIDDVVYYHGGGWQVPRTQLWAWEVSLT